MKLITFGLISGFLLLNSCTEAFAFGRGARGGGGAPPRGGGGGGHGVAAGPFGGAHVAPQAPAGFGGGRGFVTPPVRGPEIRPSSGYRPGGEIVGGANSATGGSRYTVISPEGTRGGVARGGVVGGGINGGGLAHSTAYYRPSALHDLGVGVRGRQYSYFTNDWFGRHAGAWFPGIWAGGLGFWDVPIWDNVAPFVGVVGPAIPYDYGSTAVIQDDTMYLNGDPLGPVADYAAQALALDDAGRAAAVGDSDEWEPLGVFGLMQANDTNPVRIIQLAVNKAGVVRGNYYDSVLDANLPVYGEVDKTSQRVVWSVGDRKDIVYEAGLNNLLQNETTVLIHYGKVRTQQMILVRLPPPPQPQQQPPPQPLPQQR